MSSRACRGISLSGFPVGGHEILRLRLTSFGSAQDDRKERAAPLRMTVRVPTALSSPGLRDPRQVNVSAVKSQYYLQYISIKCAINFAASLDKPKIGCIIKSSNSRAAAAPRERGGLLCLCALARPSRRGGQSAERGGKAAAFCFAAQNKKAFDGIKRHDPCGLHGPYTQIF